MYDVWRSGYVRRPLLSIVASPPLPSEITWLPSCAEFQYYADPFAAEVDGKVSVFVEAFDYRVRRGEIHYFTFDGDDRVVDRGLALSERWHLSYPSLISHAGELYMLPEAHKSGRLTLYRCVRFPDRWKPCKRLLNVPAIDATVVEHDGRWLMFFALPGKDERAMRELHVATSDALFGPWSMHEGPVLEGLERSRPGGTAFVRGGEVHLPVQDCSTTYGGALNVLRIADARAGSFRASVGPLLTAEGLLAGHQDGLHTLSGLGEVSCLDVKGFASAPDEEQRFKKRAKMRRLLGLSRPKRTPNAWAPARAAASVAMGA